MILTTCIQSIAFAAFLVFPETETKSLQGELKTAYEALQANDLGKAIKGFKGLADKNDKKALLVMGRLYQQGLPGKDGLTADAKLAESYFRKAQAAGEESAALDLAVILLNDEDAKRKTEGQDLLKAAAEKNPKAMLALGQLQANGQGFAQDLSAAKANFEKAASKGEGEAYNFLAQMYAAGQGVKQDILEAVSNYEEAAKRDSVTAMLKLGSIYAGGVKDGEKEVVKPDLAKAKEHLRNAASKEEDEKHGANATIALASFYEAFEKKPEDAYAAYQKAAKIGDYNAMVKLGNMQTDGVGTAKDLEAAFKSYLKSTAETAEGKRSGSPAGMMAVALAHEKGLGTKKDPAKAKEWTMHSALSGYAPAMRQLGLNYKDKGAPYGLQDLVASMTWLQRALQAGDAESAMILATMLENGESDVPQDYRTSNALLTKVAELGVPEAQLRLATNSAEGKGTSKDLIRAYALLLAAGDYEPAKKKLAELDKTMTAAQKAEAQKELDRMRNKPSAATAPAETKDKDKDKAK